MAWTTKTTINSLENACGVYVHVDSTGKILYVGISQNIKNRQYGHRRASSWWKDVTQIRYYLEPDPIKAWAIEIEMIKRHAPPYNKVVEKSGPPGAREKVLLTPATLPKRRETMEERCARIAREHPKT